MLKRVALAGAAMATMPLLVLLLAAASSGAASGTVLDAGLSAGSTPTAFARQDIPPQYLMWYMDAAAAECPGLPWSVLAGIGKAESDHGRSTLPGVRSGHNSAGAEGPMQFEPATFARYAVDADPGAPLTPYDPADAIYTAARMLCADGAPADLQSAIFAYNHATWYVNEVLAWAVRYAAPAGAAAKVISYALAQLGKPYQWGATGPGSFDCSGLAMMAFRAAGISIPRTSQEQWAFGPRIPASRAQPGDLVFYAGSDGTMTSPGHVGIVYTSTTFIVAPTSGQDVQIQPLNQPGLVGFTDPLSSR